MPNFNLHFDLFSIVFFLFFGLFFAVFIVILVKNISAWSKNNRSPRLSVPATVVTKREHLTHHHHSTLNGVGHGSTSTRYFVTFEVESGDRLELSVDGTDYGLLIEGDKGNLTFQGTRFLSFERRF